MSSRNAKQTIVETTIRMIQEKGYNNISTNHISKEAGVSIGTLYYHFENGKPDIIKEIIKGGYGEFLDETKLESLTIKNLPEFLQLFFTRYIEQHRKNISLLVAIELAMLSDKELFQDLDYVRSELKLYPLISKILLQLGYPDEENIDRVSKFFLNSIDSVVHRHVIHGEVVESDEELVEFMIQLILRFIKAVE